MNFCNIYILYYIAKMCLIFRKLKVYFLILLVFLM